MKNKTSWVAAAALSGLPLMAVAQLDPADPSSAAPALGYRSAFSDYKPWQEIQPADWRAVNDTVRDAKPGGHADATPSTAAPPQAAPAPQAPRSHQGHHGRGAQK